MGRVEGRGERPGQAARARIILGFWGLGFTLNKTLNPKKPYSQAPNAHLELQDVGVAASPQDGNLHSWMGVGRSVGR